MAIFEFSFFTASCIAISIIVYRKMKYKFFTIPLVTLLMFLFTSFILYPTGWYKDGQAAFLPFFGTLFAFTIATISTIALGAISLIRSLRNGRRTTAGGNTIPTKPA